MSTGKTVAIILAACASLGIIGIASCAGLLYVGYKNTDAAISPRIDAMFSAMEDGTFSDTYQTETTQELRSVATKEQYEATGQAVAMRLGALKSKTLRTFSARQQNADSYADVTYDALFEKGNGVVIASMKKVGGEWKFLSFRVTSPVFEQDLATARCPFCDKPHAKNASFCPSCGKELAKHAPQENAQK